MKDQQFESFRRSAAEDLYYHYAEGNLLVTKLSSRERNILYEYIHKNHLPMKRFLQKLEKLPEQERLYQLYQSGSDITGLSSKERSVLYRYMKSNGKKFNRKHNRETSAPNENQQIRCIMFCIRRSLILSKYRQGIRPVDLAKLLSISRQEVHRILARARDEKLTDYLLSAGLTK